MEVHGDLVRLNKSAFDPVTSTVVLTATQANSTVTPAVLTGFTFTIPPTRTLNLKAVLAFVAALTTTGAGIGLRVAQPAGANGNAQGAGYITVNVTNGSGAGAFHDGDVFNVAAGANSLFEVLSTASTAGNQGAKIDSIIKNNSTNVTTTVTVEFRSEVALSAVTMQIGSVAQWSLS
jgi:hypothetical protein